MQVPISFWIGFTALVLTLLALDLFVFHRKSHVVRFRESLAWCGVYVSLALLFCFGVYRYGGAKPAMEFLAGYLIEESLSVDNLFVFLLIFSYFRVPRSYQHKVLFWGILGALVMRALFIAGGITLLNVFDYVVYLFGAVLIYSGVKLAREKGVEVQPEHNPVLRLVRRWMPVTSSYEQGQFFVRVGGRMCGTPLFVALVLVETTDLMFAVDSIPAVLAVTRDPFIVYTSNVFAILGLRTLYFALAGVMELFHRLHYGLSAILVFVGVKMLIEQWYEIRVDVALGVVAGILLISIVASVLWPERREETQPAAASENPDEAADRH